MTAILTWNFYLLYPFIDYILLMCEKNITLKVLRFKKMFNRKKY